MTSGDGNPALETRGADETPDGKAVKLGSYAVPSANGGQPLSVEFEVRVVTGKAGEALALEQAAAIREVLAWIARNRQSSDDDHPAGT
jgi:hypothetical protein